jgi:hypothetical protein
LATILNIEYFYPGMVSAMSDQDGWHRDSKGNEHFYSHDAEWANRDIRQKEAARGSSGSSSNSGSNDAANRFQFIISIAGAACLLAAHKLWVVVEKSMKVSGYSPVVSDRVGLAAALALIALGGVLVWKAPGYLGKSVVCILYALITGYLIL